MKPDLSVEIAGIKLKNPVMTASGTFGSGREYRELVDVRALGAIVAKTVTLKKREGNPPPRICETASGMLNSIGLQNEGMEHFVNEELPFLRRFEVPIIINIAGSTVAEYVELCRKLSAAAGVSAIELNVSCPNVKAGGIAFGTHQGLVSEVVSACRRATELPLIVKLTPNVTSIAAIARSAVGAGADALSLINTIVGMAIDTATFRPKLASVVGGLSGPAIKPVAVRMVWEVARTVDIPVIGMGGVATADDAVEFMLAGATAVAIGTANFTNPSATTEIVEGLSRYLEARGMENARELIGKVRIETTPAGC